MPRTPFSFMNALRATSYGGPAKVLTLEHLPVPSPGPGQIRVRAHACAPSILQTVRSTRASLPPQRGIGFDVSGVVDALGEGVGEGMDDVANGDTVFGVPDFALHTARAKGVLPDLVRIVDDDPARLIRFGNFDEDGIGVRTTEREKGVVYRYDVLGDYAALAAQGRFVIPIARSFTWNDWQEAVSISMCGHAHGKLMLVTDQAAAQ